MVTGPPANAPRGHVRHSVSRRHARKRLRSRQSQALSEARTRARVSEIASEYASRQCRDASDERAAIAGRGKHTPASKFLLEQLREREDHATHARSVTSEFVSNQESSVD